MNFEQQAAYDLIFESRKNVFISGAAGTGKSFTLKHIIARAYRDEIPIGITATTGIAGIHIGGRTIHSFLGIGLAKKTASELYATARKSPRIMKKLKDLRILIIDEVSMMNAELLDKIHEYLSIVRGSMRPFGGVQVVLCGDFCQLPPVEGTFCFDAKCWKQANIQTVLLTKSHRQADDAKFLDILNELRWGRCSPETLKILEACKDTTFEDGILPTVLYSKNVDVDAINQEQYEMLLEKKPERKEYKTIYSKVPFTKEWADSQRVPALVDLCVGAQVMVTMNTMIGDVVIPNGARGVIKGFTASGPLVGFRYGKEYVISTITTGNDENADMSVTYIPLKLAYAITIHKSQGMTIDAVVMDLGESIFQEGQAYTAISRAKNLASIKVLSVKPRSFRTNPEVMEFYKEAGVAI